MRSLFRHWGRDEKGAAAIEFAVVSFPVIFLTFGIIELALMFTTQGLLHQAAFSASRMIRTGELQKAGGGGQEAMFRDAVCDFAKALIPCAQIQFQVEAVPSFSDAEDLPPEFDEDGNMQNTGFDPGAENDVVLIRVAYNYPVMTPLMQPILANHGSTRTMFSTVVMRTEPYQ